MEKDAKDDFEKLGNNDYTFSSYALIFQKFHNNLTTCFSEEWLSSLYLLEVDHYSLFIIIIIIAIEIYSAQISIECSNAYYNSV